MRTSGATSGPGPSTWSHAYDRGRRGRVIAVSPRRSLSDMDADEWLSIRPGTEHLVALGMARLIADARGGAAGAGADILRDVNPANAAQLAGISPDRLR